MPYCSVYFEHVYMYQFIQYICNQLWYNTYIVRYVHFHLCSKRVVHNVMYNIQRTGFISFNGQPHSAIHTLTVTHSWVRLSPSFTDTKHRHRQIHNTCIMCMLYTYVHVYAIHQHTLNARVNHSFLLRSTVHIRSYTLTLDVKTQRCFSKQSILEYRSIASMDICSVTRLS